METQNDSYFHSLQSGMAFRVKKKIIFLDYLMPSSVRKDAHMNLTSGQ